LAVGLLAADTLDVDDVFETVNGGDLALTSLVGATNDGDFVVLAKRDGADLCNEPQLDIACVAACPIIFALCRKVGRSRGSG